MNFKFHSYMPQELVELSSNSFVDDIIFYGSLFICVGIGSYYKKIENPEIKRSYGAGLGLLVACLICGQYVYHSVLMVWGNVILIKCCNKRYIHILSLSYTWLYLIYLHFNATNTKYAMWFHQTISMRLVGLAFELSISQKKPMAAGAAVALNKPVVLAEGSFKPPVEVPFEEQQKQEIKSSDNVKSVLMSSPVQTPHDPEAVYSEPTAANIITYSYFFIGIHRGPYYRWKIFEDHFQVPFGILGDCRIITEQKLKKAAICAVAYMLLQSKFSPQLYQSPEFYTYSSDTRYLYNIPQLAMYYLHMQFILILCTAVFTETGFGVYPAKCHPLPGLGPSTGQNLLKMAATSTAVALEQEYNFSMLRCFDNKKLIIGPKMHDTLRGWDMATRYWFWAYGYKHTTKYNKEIRSAFSFFLWTIWCGPSLQRFIIATSTWLYVHLESEYADLYDTDGQMKLSWDLGFGIMRLLYLLYITPCLILGDTEYILVYYNSIFWAYHLLMIGLILLVIIAHKTKK